MSQERFASQLHTPRLTLRLYEEKDMDFAMSFFPPGIVSKDEMKRIFVNIRLHKSLLGWEQEPADAHYIVHLGPSVEAPQVGLLSLCQRGKGVIPDIGWSVKSENQSKGIATEAATECLRYWHEELGLKEICALTGKDNIPSQKVAEHIGLVRKGYINMIGLDWSKEEELAYGFPSMKDFHGQTISFRGDVDGTWKV